MLTRRRYLAVAGAGLAAGCGDAGSGDADGGGGGNGGGEDGESEGFPDEDPGTPVDAGETTAGRGLVVSTPAWDDGEGIPERHTADGEDVSPPVSIESVPDDAETLALTVEDHEADDYVHWLLWDVPAGTEAIPEGVPDEEIVDDLDGARQGTNDFGEIGYRGPAPPEGDDPHRYRFTAYAVESSLDLEAGADRAALDDALDGRILDTGEFAGTYQR